MAVSKVEFSGETLIDLTEDSVTSDTMLLGTTAHDASGSTIEGSIETYLGENEETGEASDGIDISDSTVTAATLAAGEIAYTADGDRIVGILPLEWLEYIGGSGKQRINTGFMPNQDTRVVMEVEYVPTTANTFLFGARTSSSTKTYGFSNYTSKAYRVHYNNGYGDFNSAASYDGKFKIDMNKNVVTLNDGEYVYETTYAEFQCDYNLWLFDLSDSGKSAGEATAKIYSCQIYDNGTLVRNFRPCKILGIYCLYDVLNGVFYLNEGTGEFTGA